LIALGRLGRPGDEAEFGKWTRHRNATTRRIAIEQLDGIFSADAVPPLLEALKDDSLMNLRDSDLMRSLDLRPRRLPTALGAASFCRALSILGAEWLEAQAPRDQPFVVARDPYGLERHRTAALFASLPLGRAFLERKLGVPPHAIIDAQRRLAQVALLELSSVSLRVQLRPYARTSELHFRQAFAELSNQDLGLPLPEAAAGALFRLDVEDEQRLCGLLHAVTAQQRMTDLHDEDWFRNPRAIEQWRAEARLPPETTVPRERVEQALHATVKHIDELLR
jgi:hypothetical protein